MPASSKSLPYVLLSVLASVCSSSYRNARVHLIHGQKTRVNIDECFVDIVRRIRGPLKATTPKNDGDVPLSPFFFFCVTTCSAKCCAASFFYFLRSSQKGSSIKLKLSSKMKDCALL
jgi:hypothetical protein